MPGANRINVNNGTSISFPLPVQRPAPITSYSAIPKTNPQPFAGAPFYMTSSDPRFRPDQPTNQRSMLQNQLMYQQTFLANGAVSKPSSAPVRPNVAVGQPYNSNNLGFINGQSSVRVQTTAPPFPSATVTSPIGTRPAMVQSAASAVNDLDNFVIEDDDMFSTQVSQHSVEI